MNVPINNIRYSTVQGGIATPQPVQPGPFSLVGSVAATLTIASAASIGANMVDVRNGSISLPFAILNGLAKGAAASYILSKTTRSTTGEVLVAAGFLAGAAYLIDAKMKKSPQCDAVEEAEQC
jgi:hypothetical protein